MAALPVTSAEQRFLCTADTETGLTNTRRCMGVSSGLACDLDWLQCGSSVVPWQPRRLWQARVWLSRRSVTTAAAGAY